MDDIIYYISIDYDLGSSSEKRLLLFNYEYSRDLVLEKIDLFFTLDDDAKKTIQNIYNDSTGKRIYLRNIKSVIEIGTLSYASSEEFSDLIS